MSWYLLVLILLLLPFDLIISLPGMFTKTVLLSAPYILEKDAHGVLTITTVHKKSFPVRYIAVKLLVTGDDFIVKHRVLCTAEQNGKSEVTIDTSQTGVTVFEVHRIMAISLIGLFSLNVKTRNKVSVLVLPTPGKPIKTIALPRGLVLRPKPGGGYSEEHEMRNYRQGDPIRSIHWKISAKYDSLIIREPLIPPHHSRLVHIMLWDSAAGRDLILGRLRWISGYLLKWEMPYYVKYGDEKAIAEVKQEKDLLEFLRNVLDRSEKVKMASDPVPARFTWVYHINANAEAKTSTREEEEAKN